MMYTWDNVNNFKFSNFQVSVLRVFGNISRKHLLVRKLFVAIRLKPLQTYFHIFSLMFSSPIFPRSPTSAELTGGETL